MRPLTAQQMLAVWERGLDQRPFQRALALLEAACPETEGGGLAAMSIGRRDARLLTLREWTFGPRVTACAVCPSCSQPMEIDMLISDLRSKLEDTEPAPVSLTISGYELCLRPPNSLDLAACLDTAPEETTRRLFARCALAAHLESGPVGQDEVPDDVARIAIESASKADPQADVEIVMTCAACGKSTIEMFDIVSFFWSEIDSWARRILREIHTLASAYGWRESEILALSPLRRQFYLEMASA